MHTLPYFPPSERISLIQLAHEEGFMVGVVDRWATYGIGGCNLPFFNVGNVKFTTRVAFEAWCEIVTAFQAAEAIELRARRRQRRKDAMKLDAAGADARSLHGAK